MRIGILALQGAFIEHKQALDKLHIESFEIRQRKDLAKPFDALIIPGGESTTRANLLHKLDLMNPLRELIKSGLPVWGTCAGMILLAKEIIGEQPHMGLMDITVRRNAYGKQIDSFSQEVIIPQVSANPIPLVFIRAPWIERAGDQVDILCRLNDRIVAARQDNMLVTSFHPELTNNTDFVRYFLKMAQKQPPQ